MTDVKPIVLGAVMYDPKVTVIWRIIREFFESKSCPLVARFYKSYELQTEALLEREIDVAWDSPLAWVDSQRRSGSRCRAIAMRDTDRDRITHFVVRKAHAGGGVASLRGKTIAFGAKDSPQATLIPMEALRAAGLEAGKDYRVRRFDVGIGLHGDHVGGELDAFKALERGEAAASVMLDLNWDRWTRDGTVSPEAYAILASTGRFDHCCFAVRDDLPKEREARFLDALFSMSYDDPKHREMMDLEGLKKWLPGRTTGYALLESATRSQNFFST